MRNAATFPKAVPGTFRPKRLLALVLATLFSAATAMPSAMAQQTPTHTAGPDYDTDCYTFGCSPFFNKPPQAGDGVCLSDFSRQFPSDPNKFYSTGRFTYYSVQVSMSKFALVGTWEKGTEPPFPIPWTYNGTTYQVNAGDVNVGTSIERRAYPTAYRPDFTTPAKEKVWTIPAGLNYWYWVVEADIGKNSYANLPGDAPHYQGGKTGNWSLNQREAGGAYPGNWTFSRMVTDKIYDYFTTKGYHYQNAWRNAFGQIPGSYSPIHPDPQQFATRFVLKTPFAQNLKDFDYGQAPDIDVPDSVVMAAAQENASKLTEATLERLRGYVDSGNVERNYLDLNASATIQDQIGDNKHAANGNPYGTMWMVDMGTEQASCGTFAEIVKHPRLKDVYMLKYFIRSITMSGVLEPLPTWQNGATFVAYAPYLLGPGYEAPTLSPDSVTAPANEEAVIKPLENDKAGSTGTLSLVGVSTPAHGTVTWNGDNVTYMPDEDWSGMDTMVYTATDGIKEYTSTIAVNVQSVPPILAPDQIVTGHTVPITFNVLLNDKDIDGPNPLRVTSVEQPEHGAISFKPDGTLTFVPEKGFIGTQTATYTATDGFNTAESFVVITTIQCFDDVWHDAGLVCSGRNPQGSADFAASCQYLPSGYEQIEKTCPAN